MTESYRLNPSEGHFWAVSTSVCRHVLQQFLHFISISCIIDRSICCIELIIIVMLYCEPLCRKNNTAQLYFEAFNSYLASVFIALGT